MVLAPPTAAPEIPLRRIPHEVECASPNFTGTEVKEGSQYITQDPQRRSLRDTLYYTLEYTPHRVSNSQEVIKIYYARVGTTIIYPSQSIKEACHQIYHLI